MQAGDQIRLRNVRHYPPNNPEAEARVVSADYVAPDGQTFVVLVLGAADRDAVVSTEAILNRMGWRFDPDYFKDKELPPVIEREAPPRPEKPAKAARRRR